MPSFAAVSTGRNRSNLGLRAADALRQAARVAHEARALRTRATDVLEDRVYASRRALTRGVRQFGDMRESVTHGIKRSPIKAMGMAFGAGMLLGVVSRSITRASVRMQR